MDWAGIVLYSLATTGAGVVGVAFGWALMAWREGRRK